MQGASKLARAEISLHFQIKKKVCTIFAYINGNQFILSKYQVRVMLNKQMAKQMCFKVCDLHFLC